MKFYGYPKCSTCQKLKKELLANNISFDEYDITADIPSTKTLKQAVEKYGIQRMFNTSGQVYREMKLKEKLPTLSEQEQLKLLSSNGKLIRRPIVVSKEKITVGNDKAFAEVWL